MTLDVRVVRERRRRAPTRIALTGEVDSETSADLLERLLPLVRAGRGLRIDLAGVSYVSSAGLRTLLVLYREAQHAGVRVVLTGVGEEVRLVMSATGFLDFFESEGDGDGDGAGAAGSAGGTATGTATGSAGGSAGGRRT